MRVHRSSEEGQAPRQEELPATGCPISFFLIKKKQEGAAAPTNMQLMACLLECQDEKEGPGL